MQSDLLGQTIGGRYRIIAVLGSGGMGKVYRAYDETLKRDVALKVVTTSSFGAGAEERFLREGQALARLSHPNILPIFDLFSHEGSVVLVMFFVSGTNVERMLHDGPLSLEQVERIVRQAAAALDDAHSNGIIHRDVKPANMLIDEKGNLLLTDFGIAKLESDRSLTQTGQTLGSLYYMSPEVIQAQPVDFRSDIYSLAVSTFEMVTGKRAFDGESDFTVMMRHVKAEYPRVLQVNPNVPAALAEAIERGMALRPEDRFPSATAFAEAAFPQRAGPSAATSFPSRISAWQGRRVEFTAGALIVLAAAVLLYQWFAHLSIGWPIFVAALGCAVLVLLSKRQFSSTPLVSLTLDDPQIPVEDVRKATYPPVVIDRSVTATDSSSIVAQPVSEQVQSAPAMAPARLGTQPYPTLESPQPPKPGGPGEFTMMFEAPPSNVPPGVPGSQSPPAPSSRAAGEFTSMFATAAAPGRAEPPPWPPAAPPLPFPVTAVQPTDLPIEGTRVFSVGAAGATPAPQQRPEVALVVSSCTDPAYLGRRQNIASVPFRIGRAADASDFALSFDRALSRAHAEVDFRDGGYVIRDLASSNGTFVNGRKLTTGEDEPLFYGSRILLGSDTELIFTANEMEEIPDLTGQVIEQRFTLVEKIHSSAKSAVYTARDSRLKSMAVVKLLSPRLAGHPGYRDQFKREAEIASSLRFPNICRVIDYGETQLASDPPVRTVYVCLEHMEGGSLLGRLSAGEHFEPARVAGWVEKIAAALDQVHAQNVVHGGIKPSSIVFDSRNEPYLTDFALASTHADGQRRAVTGSPGFLAPEQWEGELPTPLSDQYSFGVLVYLLVTGALPHVGQDNREVRAFNFLRGAVPAHEMAARTGRTPVPSAVSAVLARAMSTKPADRYASATAFAHNFHQALNTANERRQISVFISYRRSTCSPWALLLKRELERAHGFDVFVDTEQRDSAGRFPAKLVKNIERCDVFVCLLAKTTLQSDWVNQEISCAAEKKKPMIPILRQYEVPRELGKYPGPVQELLSYDGIKLYPEWVDAAVEKLAKSIRQSVVA